MINNTHAAPAYTDSTAGKAAGGVAANMAQGYSEAIGIGSVTALLAIALATTGNGDGSDTVTNTSTNTATVPR